MMRRSDWRCALTSRWLTYVLVLIAAGLSLACLGRAGSWRAFEWGVLIFCLLLVSARLIFFRLWQAAQSLSTSRWMTRTRWSSPSRRSRSQSTRATLRCFPPVQPSATSTFIF